MLCFALEQIIDTVPPTITCPNDIVTTSSQASWPNPTATDNVDISPDILCNTESGSTFPLGVTIVECAATDAAGNSAVCSFTVTRGKFCGLCLGWGRVVVFWGIREGVFGVIYVHFLFSKDALPWINILTYQSKM